LSDGQKNARNNKKNMSWVKEALEELKKGNLTKVRPIGGSMRGRIESGQLVTLKPAKFNDVEVDDVIFITWKGNYILHLVLDKKDNELQIGNNIGKINGWVSADALIAKVILVED
jgi:hypothetical protein